MITFGNNQTHGNNMFMLKEPGYDAVKDFAPLAGVGAFEHVFVTKKDLPVKGIQDVIALAKAKPTDLNYGSTGIGSGLAPVHRAVHGPHRHQDDARALSRRSAAGAGHAGRTHRHRQFHPEQRHRADPRLASSTASQSAAPGATPGSPTCPRSRSRA